MNDLTRIRLTIEADVWGAQKKQADEEITKIINLVSELRSRGYLGHLKMLRENVE